MGPLTQEERVNSVRAMYARLGNPEGSADAVLQLQAEFPRFNVWYSLGKSRDATRGPGYYADAIESRDRLPAPLFAQDPEQLRAQLEPVNTELEERLNAWAHMDWSWTNDGTE